MKSGASTITLEHDPCSFFGVVFLLRIIEYRLLSACILQIGSIFMFFPFCFSEGITPHVLKLANCTAHSNLFLTILGKFFISVLTLSRSQISVTSFVYRFLILFIITFWLSPDPLLRPLGSANLIFEWTFLSFFFLISCDLSQYLYKTESDSENHFLFFALKRS